MNRLGRGMLAWICLLAVTLPVRAVSAQVVISSVTRPDISQGVLKGTAAAYTFVIPTAWEDDFFVERDTSLGSPLEQLSFYFQPADKVTKPARFMRLSIYNKSSYDPAHMPPEALETSQYVFAYEIFDSQSFPSSQDAATYRALVNLFGNDLRLAALIQVPSPDRKILHNTVTVNGMMLFTHLIPESNRLYLPLREVAAALGYAVSWDGANQNVILLKGNTSVMLMTRSGLADPQYDPSNRGGTVYVLPTFFVNVMHTTWDMDDKNNVYIRLYE